MEAPPHRLCLARSLDLVLALVPALILVLALVLDLTLALVLALVLEKECSDLSPLGTWNKG